MNRQRSFNQRQGLQNPERSRRDAYTQLESMIRSLSLPVLQQRPSYLRTDPRARIGKRSTRLVLPLPLGDGRGEGLRMARTSQALIPSPAPKGRRGQLFALVSWIGAVFFTAFPRSNLQHRTGLAELQPRGAWEKLRRITVTKVAQKVGLHMTVRKELLLAAFTFTAGAKKFFIQFRVVES